MAKLFLKLLIPSFVIFYLSFVIFSGGCGDLTSEVSELTISPSSATVGINKSHYFSVICKNSLGNIVQATPTWSVEGEIGTINSAGVFVAASTEGSGRVVASYASLSSRSTVSITTKGWLTGILRTPAGAYAQGIVVYLSGHAEYSDDTDASGSYLIGSIPPGTYEAMTRETQTYAVASSEVTIGSGETVTWSTSLTLKPNVPTLPTTTIPSF